MRTLAADQSWLAEQWALARRAGNRAKREGVARFEPARRVLDRRYEERLRAHAAQLPPLDSAATGLVRELQTEGISYQRFEELAGDQFETLASILEGMLGTMAKPPAAGSTVRPTDEELLAHAELFRWGLSERMLAIAENYLGLPVWYYGTDVRREIGDGVTADVRQWHKDVEDRRMFKILVWLNDVDKSGGPFGYLSMRSTQEATPRLRYVGGFVSDERMAAVVPRGEWHAATGPKWTAVCVDTATLFHRATPPTARDRFSVTFTWTSRHPVKMHEVPGNGAVNAKAALASLSRRQREALAPQWSQLLED